MIVKGIILETPSSKLVNKGIQSNKYKVRVPAFEPAGTTEKAVLECNLCCVVGEEFNYIEGDVVYVGFENNNLNLPVILGKLLCSKNSSILNATSTTNISGEAVNLPDNTFYKGTNLNNFIQSLIDKGVSSINITGIVSGSYDSDTKEIIFVLDNGNTIRIPVEDLVEDLVTSSELENAIDTLRDSLEQDIGSKVDKLTGSSDQDRVYIHTSNGQESSLPVSANSATANSVVQRGSNGNIYAGGTGTTFADGDAVNKNYVDISIGEVKPRFITVEYNAANITVGFENNTDKHYVKKPNASPLNRVTFSIPNGIAQGWIGCCTLDWTPINSGDPGNPPVFDLSNSSSFSVYYLLDGKQLDLASWQISLSANATLEVMAECNGLNVRIYARQSVNN